MKRLMPGLTMGLALCGGCGGGSTPPPPEAAPSVKVPLPAPAAAPLPASASARDPLEDQVVARLNGEPMTMGQLVKPLVESHGLPMLLNLAQLRVAQQEAAKQHVQVTAADCQAERELTLNKLFKEADDKTQDELDKAVAEKKTAEVQRLQAEMRRDHTQLLDQFLQNQHISETEFGIILQINAIIRKISAPAVKAAITDSAIRSAFGQQYGETVQVQYIQLANPQEVEVAKQRLAKGERFGDVARDMSRNRASAALEGELPPFSRNAPGVPQTFKDVAFTLQPGQVSDELEAGGNFYLIKLQEKFPPKAVKYEDVKQAVTERLYDVLMQANLKQMREQLLAKTLQSVEIDEPVLKRQFEEQRQAQVHDRETMNRDMERERQRLATLHPPATAPSTRPVMTHPATGPAAPEPQTAPAAVPEKTPPPPPAASAPAAVAAPPPPAGQPASVPAATTVPSSATAPASGN